MRGLFVVFEGLDRSGKTTQCNILYERMKSQGMDVVKMAYPDRSTDMGKLIGKYLELHTPLERHAAHLAFSANRWEQQEKMHSLLKSGCSIVCDRYAFSGVCYSSGALGLDLEWCRWSDGGQIAPDVVFYMMSGANDDLLASRGSTGERYERDELQRKVGEAYERLFAEYEVGGNRVVRLDASLSIQELAMEIEKKLDGLAVGSNLKYLWS